MSTTLVNAESVLAIDIGSVNTRAILFDVVEGRYRFLARSTAPTTAGAPYRDVLEGIYLVLQQLQTATGQVLLNPDQTLITPTQSDGTGVDRCVVTLSAGPAMKTVLVGLLEDVSVQSAHNLVNTTYASVQEVINLNDRRKTASRLDAILRVRPDLIVIAGGTQNGASHSLHTLLEPVGLACYMLPKENRPQVLFAGNQALADEVKSQLASVSSLQIAPNIRPSLETEHILPAQKKLAHAYRQLRARQVPGTLEVDRWTGGNLLPTAMAFGRTIRFTSKVYASSRKGVLGVDVGASSTTIAAGFGGDLRLNVYPHLGLGDGSLGVLSASSLEDIIRWLPVDIEPAVVRDYIYNKNLHPASLPVTSEELAIEQALATQAIRIALKKSLRSFPENVLQASGSFLPAFEPIIASGGALAEAPQRGQALMMLLNALQPVGVTTLALDQNNIAAALGAAAESTPLLTIQSLDASNFVSLCTVISPVGHAPAGTPVLRIKITHQEGDEETVDVKNGALELIPIPLGQVVNIHLQPLHRFDVGLGAPGRGGTFKTTGGLMGLVVDARGRPLNLSPDPARRLDQMQKWHWVVSS